MEVRDEFNWNTDPDESDLVLYYLTDFCVKDSVGEICSPLLCGCEDHVLLEGTLISKTNPLLRKPHQTVVENYFVDLGVETTQDGESSDSDKGVWLYGRDPDVRYKLVLPASPTYVDFSSHVQELTGKQNGLDCCSHPYDSSTAFHMSNFAITDRILGTFQTPLLTAYGKNPLALRGTVRIHDFDRASRQGFPADLTEVCVQTYVQSTYVVDFGPVPSLAPPHICVKDCHGNWIVLQEPCHPDYETDYRNTWRRTVGNLSGYNWPAEGDDTWRHITNYRLTTADGLLHDLEIGELEGGYILWGDLTPPDKAPCPPIAVKIYVTTHSIDVGRHLQDPEKGVWMHDVRGDWYKLITPAPEYQTIAQSFLHKAEQFIRFHDALLYQSTAATVSAYVPESLKYICMLSVVAVHTKANPKFDLHFVQENKDFVKLHLAADFDLKSSAMLVYSIDHLNGHSNGARPVASASTAEATVTTRQGQLPKHIEHQHRDDFVSSSGSTSSNKTASLDASDSDDLTDTFAAPVRKKGTLVTDAVPQKRGRGRPPKNRTPDTASSNNKSNSMNKNKVTEGPRKITKKAPVVTIDTSSEEEEEEFLPNKKTTTTSGAAVKTKRVEPTVPPEPPARGRAGNEQVDPAVSHKRSHSTSNFNYVFASATTAAHTTTTTAPALSKATPTTTSILDTATARSSTASRPSLGDTAVQSKPKRSRFEEDPVLVIPVIPVPQGSDQAYPYPGDSRYNSVERYTDQRAATAPVPVVSANTPRFQPLLPKGPGFGDALSSYQQQQHLVPPPAPVPRPPSVGGNGTGTGGGGGMTRWEAYHTELRGDDRRTNSAGYAYSNDQGFVPPPLSYAAPVVSASRPLPPPTPPPMQNMPPPPVPPRSIAPSSTNNFPESRDPRLKNRNGGGKSRFDDTPDPTSSVPSARQVVPQPQSQAADSRCGADRDSRDGTRAGQFQDAPVPGPGPGSGSGPGPGPVRRDVSATSQGSYSGSDTGGAATGMGAGRGRGKSATLPAWMTAGGNGNDVSANVGNSNSRANLAPPMVPSRNSDPRYSNRCEENPRESRREDGNGDRGFSAASNAGGYPTSVGGGGSGSGSQGQGSVRGGGGGGRGRDATLPAWMTSQQFAPPPPAVLPPQSLPKQSASLPVNSYQRNGNGAGRERQRSDSRERDRYANPRGDREADRNNSGWQRDSRDNQRDVSEVNRSSQSGNNNAFHPSFLEQVDRLRQQQPPTAVSMNIPTVRDPCVFCHGRKKLKNCPIDDHVTGMLVAPHLNTLNRSFGGSAPVPLAVPCADGRGCGTPEHYLDQSVGIDSKAANEEAANALLDMFGGGSGVQDENADSTAPPAVLSSHPGSTSPVVALPSSAATPLAAATVGKGDDMSVERARYLQSKQQHSAEQCNSHDKGQDTKNGAEPAIAPASTGSVAPKHGKWGLLSSPRSLGLVKLGAKQDDPKKRLEQTRRNSLGAFAATTLAGAGALGAQEMQGDRHCPPSRSARPGKSCLRSGSFGSAGDTVSEVSATSSALNGHSGGAGGAAGAVAGGGSSGGARVGTEDGHLKWQDMSGKSLSTRHVYENEFDLEPPAEAVV